jgi:hypothetical protein
MNNVAICTIEPETRKNPSVQGEVDRYDTLGSLVSENQIDWEIMQGDKPSTGNHDLWKNNPLFVPRDRPIMPINVEVQSTLYKRIGGINYLKLASTEDQVGTSHPEAKVPNGAQIPNELEEVRPSEGIIMISRSAKRRARRKAQVAQQAIRPDAIQNIAANITGSVKEYDRDSGKESVNHFPEFHYGAESPTVIMEEGELSPSPQVIIPPVKQFTNYLENVKEWRRKYWATQVNREEPEPAEPVKIEGVELKILDKSKNRIRRDHGKERKIQQNSKRCRKHKRRRARKSYVKHCNRQKHNYGIMHEPQYEFHGTELEDNSDYIQMSPITGRTNNSGLGLLSAKDVLWQTAVHLVQNPNWLWNSLGDTKQTSNFNSDGMEIHFPRPKLLQRQNANMTSEELCSASSIGPWVGCNSSGDTSFYEPSENNNRPGSSSGTSALLRNTYKWRKRHGCLEAPFEKSRSPHRVLMMVPKSLSESDSNLSEDDTDIIQYSEKRVRYPIEKLSLG